MSFKNEQGNKIKIKVNRLPFYIFKIIFLLEQLLYTTAYVGINKKNFPQTSSLSRRRNLTLIRNDCEAALRSLFWAPIGPNEFWISLQPD